MSLPPAATFLSFSSRSFAASATTATLFAWSFRNLASTALTAFPPLLGGGGAIPPQARKPGKRFDSLTPLLSIHI